MKKIVVATHHRLAEGLKSTFDYIAPNTVEIIAISAYLENISVESQVQAALDQFESGEQILVFTDLLGGSVNQTFAKFLDSYNIELIAGVNLPVLMTLALAIGGGDLGETTIRQALEDSRQQIVYVNDMLQEQAMDDMDE